MVLGIVSFQKKSRLVALDINRWLVGAVLDSLTHLARAVLGQHSPKVYIRGFMILLLRRKATFFDVSRPKSVT
jgi:hypothetical protein